ncbi:hypothetical protein C1646_766781 [Rhizophagus diaphanus]|nr:hypothetical protein C1646_766781 [Rhizophagus diaphanus] [Rhizophagus sp. MUCL 43196]
MSKRKFAMRRSTQKKTTQQEDTIELETDSNSTKDDPVKISQKVTQRKRNQKNTIVLESPTLTPQKPSSKTTRKSKKQDVQLSEGSNNNEDSNNIVSTSPIPAEESLEDFLSNGSAPSEYILSDNETCNQQEFASRGSSKSSVTLLTPSQMQSSQESFHVQELFQVKSAEIPKKIRNVAVEVNIQSKKPIQFQNMTNEFEIAYWLAHHKSILDLAMNIRKGMMTSSTNEESSISTSPPNTLVQHSFEPVSTPLEIDQHVRYQLQEECKALFLRTRNNTAELYEELIVQVCKISKTDIRLGSLVKDIARWVEEPYDKLTEFITDDAWRQAFHLHLKATDLVKLRKDDTIVTNLNAFVRQAVKNVLIVQNKNEDTQTIIKKCDEYTIDLKISTKLGIVKSLSVRKLLMC